MFEVGDVVRYVGNPPPHKTMPRSEGWNHSGLYIGDVGIIVMVDGPFGSDNQYIGVRFFNTPYPPAHADRGYWVMYPYELQVEKSNVRR